MITCWLIQNPSLLILIRFLAAYSTLTEITPEVLNDVIERIEIGHVTNKSKPGKIIQIYWKLN